MVMSLAYHRWVASHETRSQSLKSECPSWNDKYMGTDEWAELVKEI